LPKSDLFGHLRAQFFLYTHLLAVREFEAGQEKNFCNFLLHNPLQGVEKACTFSLPFESDKAKAE
jgi:hypothetical protein